MQEQEREKRHRERLGALGQGHVFGCWTDLDAGQRARLLDDLDGVPYDVLERVARCGLRSLAPEVPEASALKPVDVVDRWEATAPGGGYEGAGEAGRQALRSGAVAVVTVAGGQGTRLGYAGPKGTYPIGPVSGNSLFEILAQAVRGASRRYGVTIPWYVMTSPATHEATLAFFAEHQSFGLAPGQVRFFCQGTLPAVGIDGKLLLGEPHRLACSPDGHGGLLEALGRGGHLERMQREGTRHLSLFQVDNPMVYGIDPVFLGMHLRRGADISCKALEKAHERERLGTFCEWGGKTHCIEYSDLPEEHAQARTAGGALRFGAGNISIYVVEVALLERLWRSGVKLPVHPARKKVPCLDISKKRMVEPSAPNAIKMERFVFDVLPQAREVLIVRTRRDEEFGPVKTLTGDDSVESCRRSMVRRASRWLREAGVPVPYGEDGEPLAVVELSPALAEEPVELREQLGEEVRIGVGERLYLG